MWDLPRLGVEPVSPALAGGLITTGPSGKPSGLNLDGAHCSYLFNGSSYPLDMVSSDWVSAPGLGNRYRVVCSLRHSQLHTGRKTQGKRCRPQAQGAWGDHPAPTGSSYTFCFKILGTLIPYFPQVL